MAITKKPEQKAQIQVQAISEEKARAFIKGAAVNQETVSNEGEEKKKPLLLRLWQSEIDQIDAALASAASKKTGHSRRKITRHAWIVEAILEKLSGE